MKSLRMFFLAVALCFTGTATILAQSAANVSNEQKEEMKQQIEAQVAELKLTEAQKTPYKEISMKYMEQMMALRDSDASKMSKYRELKSIRKNKNGEMKELLNKEQYKIYEEQQKENQAKMKERRKNQR